MPLTGGKRSKSRKVRKSRKTKRGKSAKVGSKSNPYKNKTRCLKGNRNGKVYYKKKGRTVAMKKKK